MNFHRQREMGLGTLAQYDGTNKVNDAGKPVVLIGVLDIRQKFHVGAGGVLDSENILQAHDFLDTVLEFTNLMLQDRSLPLYYMDWCATDNSDALQEAARRAGADNAQCNVHLVRHVKDVEICVPDGQSRKGIVKDIRAALFKFSNLTLSEGVYRPNDIVEVVRVLLEEKYEETQPRLVANLRNEYKENGKGNYVRALLNPGLPPNTNGCESKNDGFKNDGNN